MTAIVSRSASVSRIRLVDPEQFVVSVELAVPARVTVVRKPVTVALASGLGFQLIGVTSHVDPPEADGWARAHAYLRVEEQDRDCLWGNTLIRPGATLDVIVQFMRDPRHLWFAREPRDSRKVRTRRVFTLRLALRGVAGPVVIETE